MAQQMINFGTPPNGSDGDTRRAALDKLQSNDTELYGLVASTVGFKNKLINSNFDVWQSGTSFAVNGYTADQWYFQINGVTGAQMQQSIWGVNDPNNTTGAKIAGYAGITGNTDTVNHYCNLQQRIESVQSCAGKKMVLSGKIYSAVARSMAVEFVQSFGAGGSAAITAIGVTTVNLVAGWNAIDVPVIFPTIAAGTVIGAGDYYAVYLWISAGTTYTARTNGLGAQSGTLAFSAMQLEEGTTPTKYNALPYGVELISCQRFYETRGAYLNGYGAASSSVAFDVPFAVVKRASPTITWPNAAYANASGINLVAVSNHRLVPQITVTSLGGALFNGTWIADARL